MIKRYTSWGSECLVGNLNPICGEMIKEQDKSSCLKGLVLEARQATKAEEMVVSIKRSSKKIKSQRKNMKNSIDMSQLK